MRLGELDVDGHVHPHRVLEWMQEAAAHASAARGYPPARYEAMGAAWFIREVLLVLERPILHGEAIRVETWVSDLRRFRSRREHRVWSGGELVARGQADWMLLELDRASGRVKPRVPDPALDGAFPRDPETALEPAEGPPLGPVDSAMEGARDEREVRYSELDRNGHVNHVNYLAWVEDHARKVLGPAPLRLARLEYRADARPGDRVELVLGEAAGRVEHVALRGGQVLLRAVTLRR